MCMHATLASLQWWPGIGSNLANNGDVLGRKLDEVVEIAADLVGLSARGEQGLGMPKSSKRFCTLGLPACRLVSGCVIVVVRGRGHRGLTHFRLCISGLSCGHDSTEVCAVYRAPSYLHFTISATLAALPHLA